jgi:putative hydrolase of the HAD superfamily
MSLKVITIDFWNTLYDSTNGIERNKIRNDSIRRALAKVDYDISDKDLKEAIRMAWAHFNELWIKQMRTPLPKESVEYFWDYLKLPNDEKAIDEVVKSFETAILECPPMLMKDVAYVLDKLTKDYKLAIISDTGFTPGTILKTVMDKSGVLDYFSAFSFSDETGVAKPHPKAYLKVLEELDCLPENALHIGDIEQTDVEGAKKLGMRAIRFSGDPTYINKPNPKKTVGDAESFSWNEVLIEIRRIESGLF